MYRFAELSTVRLGVYHDDFLRLRKVAAPIYPYLEASAGSSYPDPRRPIS